ALVTGMSIASVLLSNTLNSKAPALTEAHPSLHCRPALSPSQLALGQIPRSAKSPLPENQLVDLAPWGAAPHAEVGRSRLLRVGKAIRGAAMLRTTSEHP